MADSGTIELDILGNELAQLGDMNACVTAVIQRVGADWEVLHMSVLAGYVSESWKDRIWQYEELAFVACRIPVSALSVLGSSETSDVAGNVEDGEDREEVPQPDIREVVLGSIVARLPKMRGPANWRREASHSRLDRVPLPRPAVVFSVSAKDGNRALPWGILAAIGCPSFPSPHNAWRAFEKGDFSLGGEANFPNDLVSIRLAENDGWIGDVRVSATHLVVEVKGYNLTGCELEVYSASGVKHHPVDGPTTFRLALDGGLPDDSWLWLKRETKWLDYRSISPQSSWTGDLAVSGVYFDESIDEVTKIEALLSVGEGPTVEYKEKLIKSADDRRNLKTIPAFANENGGTIVFGMHQDELTRVGVEDGDRIKQRDQLVNLIRAAVEPMPQVNVNHYVVDGISFLVAEVAPGQSPPYGLITAGSARDKPEYYVRRGASTYLARPADLREIVLARSQNANSV
ncbi:ATP-binding protein [Kutzneria sp. NPDC051319]|uniref:AlbA family DNA-binding domain-containing protein n=1 Tax=Kutzneria sp. NPDC051319 TaxID=3155047 RepID=UPI0034401A6A